MSRRSCRATPTPSAPSRWCSVIISMPISPCCSATWNAFGRAYDRADVSALGSAAMAGATYPLDREFVAADLGLRWHHRQQHGRHRRPRFRARCPLRLLADPASSLATERRAGLLVERRIPVHRNLGCVFDRQLDHAAEEECRCRGADPGPLGPGLRQFAGHADDDEGLAAHLQQRYAGRQGSALRSVRYGATRRCWSIPA